MYTITIFIQSISRFQIIKPQPVSLTFQCLVDCVGMSCTLVRGEYNRAWNEVLLFNGNPSCNGCSSKPYRYIVDLMHQPGSLLAVNTPAALQYQII